MSSSSTIVVVGSDGVVNSLIVKNCRRIVYSIICSGGFVL